MRNVRRCQATICVSCAFSRPTSNDHTGGEAGACCDDTGLVFEFDCVLVRAGGRI
jgi:hypothetical protein